MADVCDNCKALEKHKYWHEVPSKKHHFFKIMLGNFENQLRIPRKFVECFGESLSHSCTLRGQSGNIWKVQIIQTEEDVLFSNGWERFVRDHGIKYGYLLVFRYAGDSSFEVSVFDATGCEYEGSYFRNNSNSSSKSSCQSLLHLESSISTVTNAQEAETGGHEESENSSDQGNQKGSRSIRLSRRRGISQGRQSIKYHASKRRKVTEQEKQDALDMAISHMKSRSTRNMIEIVMLPSHVYSGFHLTIPKEWAVEHMLREPHEVILRVAGVEGIWKVGCRWTPWQCQISRGWSKFVLENNLEEHDVCVFELLKKRKSGSNKKTPVFNVYIFRVVKEVAPLTVSRRMPRMV